MLITECCDRPPIEGTVSILTDRNDEVVEQAGRCSKCKEVALLNEEAQRG